MPLTTMLTNGPDLTKRSSKVKLKLFHIISTSADFWLFCRTPQDGFTVTHSTPWVCYMWFEAKTIFFFKTSLKKRIPHENDDNTVSCTDSLTYLFPFPAERNGFLLPWCQTIGRL